MTRGKFGADLERIDKLQRDFEAEVSRIVGIIRRARHEMACAQERLHNSLALEIYAERKAREFGK